jgi:hypothetical protein
MVDLMDSCHRVRSELAHAERRPWPDVRVGPTVVVLGQRINHYLKHHCERFDPVKARTLERRQPSKWGHGCGADAT